MKSIRWAALVRWYGVGVVVSFVVALIISGVQLARFGPRSDEGGFAGALLDKPLIITLVCIALAPIAIVALYSWIRMAESHPTIEQRGGLRLVGLTGVAVLVSIAGYVGFSLWVALMLSPNVPWFDLVRRDWLLGVPLALYVVVAIVSPRIVDSTLRSPLAWRARAVT